MPTWASASDVAARLSYATISSASKPTTAQVEEWIDEAEASIRGVLLAQGLGTTYASGTDGDRILQRAAADYAEGRVLNAWSAIDGTSPRPGDPLIAKFEAFLEQLRDRTVQLGGELAGGDLSDTVIGPRSYVTDNEDSLTIADGDFAPAITTTWKD